MDPEVGCEDLELVDYSSDQLEEQDVWRVPAGGRMEGLEDFTRMGPVGTFSTEDGMLGQAAAFTPSDFLNLSPHESVQGQVDSDGLQVDLWGSDSWREAGDFFARNLGFPVIGGVEGFEEVEGFEATANVGVARQVETACGVGGEDAAVDPRVPLEESEHRGYSNPSSEEEPLKGTEGIPTGAGEASRGNPRAEEVPLKGTAGFPPGVGEPSRNTKRRKRRWIKIVEGGRYAVGDDIAWEKVLKMSQRTIVGRVMGRVFAQKTVVGWMVENWKDLLGYVPEVDMLLRGWFAVELKSEADMRLLLNKIWHWNRTPMLLKPWHPLFDASRERVDKIPVWVRLPGLPLHFWGPDHFNRIGDILGTFLEADLSYKETHMKQVARILVELNIREGLPASMILDWGPTPITQLLDYENLPFRCRRCHTYGHPVADCHLPLRTLNGGKRKARKMAAEGDSGDKESTEPLPMSDDSGKVRVSDDSEPSSDDSEMVLAALVVSSPSTLDSSAHPAPVEESAPPGPAIPGITKLSLSPSINFMLNQCTMVGLDWMEGLKNLSISGPTEEGFVASLGGRGGDLKLKVGSVTEPNVEPSASKAFLIEEAPPILEPDPGIEAEGMADPSPANDEAGYFLRSRTKKGEGGLGKDPPSVRRGRGRISNLSKAQSKAVRDLRDGKQLSIERALRAVDARESVKK